MKRFLIIPLITAAAIPLQAAVFITEVNSNGAGGDFFEIHNTGPTSVSLDGWKWTDSDLRAWSTAFTLDNATIAAGGVAVILAGSGNGTSTAADAFRTTWTVPPAVQILTWTGAGAGLGSGDGVVLFNGPGFAETYLMYRTGTRDITNIDTSLTTMSTFVRTGETQPDANGHAGVMGGGLGQASLVWDPSSGTTSPTYAAAVSGTFGAYGLDATTIGSPGLIPEPSVFGLVGLGALAAFRRRRGN